MDESSKDTASQTNPPTEETRVADPEKARRMAAREDVYRTLIKNAQAARQPEVATQLETQMSNEVEAIATNYDKEAEKVKETVEYIMREKGKEIVDILSGERRFELELGDYSRESSDGRMIIEALYELLGAERPSAEKVEEFSKTRSSGEGRAEIQSPIPGKKVLLVEEYEQKHGNHYDSILLKTADSLDTTPPTTDPTLPTT